MMINKKNTLPGILIISAFTSAPLYAQTETNSSTNIQKQMPFVVGLEYLKPTNADRQLTSRNLDFFYPMAAVEKINLSVYLGLTATLVTGDISQLIGDLQAGTLQEVVYESSATGIGPNILAKVKLFKLERLSGAVDAGGAVILYDRDFPAGGSHYNFMWRIGPVFSYAVGRSSSLGISYRWMHVSNGEGVSPENPSYDAKGVGIQFAHLF